MLRTSLLHPHVEVVAINDPFVDPNYMEYMWATALSLCSFNTAALAPLSVCSMCVFIVFFIAGGVFKYLAPLPSPLTRCRFKYDTVHGKFRGEVTSDGSALYVDGHKIDCHASM